MDEKILDWMDKHDADIEKVMIWLASKQAIVAYSIGTMFMVAMDVFVVLKLIERFWHTFMPAVTLPTNNS